MHRFFMNYKENMVKAIIEMFSNFMKITGNAEIDGVLLTIIGIISFSVAFNMVGVIFDAIGFYDSNIMSNVHWLIRVCVFCGLTYILIKITELVTWLFNIKWWIYLIVFFAIVLVIFVAYYIRYRMHKHKNIVREVEQEENLEISECTKGKDGEKVFIAYSRYNCPRCGSKLVKRHGPYGFFYGCESYAKTGCRYTRKFL